MRRHSFARLSTLLAVWAAPWAFAADTPLDETKTRIALPMDRAPIIDGFIDNDEWAQSGNAGWAFAIVDGDPEPGDDGITGADLRNGDKPTDSTDLSANLYAGVVGENLYIGVRVTDDDISTDSAEARSENGMTWQDDSVEVFIDGDNSNFGERDTTGENPEVVDTGGQFVITANNAYRHAEAGNPKFDPSSGWFAETTIIEGEGYHAEFRIPLSMIGNPQPGEHIGFTVAVNDDDGGGNQDSVLIWTGLDHVEETYGNLVVGHRRYEGLRVESPPTIDGVIEDGEYSGSDVVSINPFTGVFRVGDDQPRADDISFDWRVMHDDDAIYVAVRVTDDVLFNDGAEPGEENGNTWNDDSVEIFFDSNESNLSGRDQDEMFDGQFVMTANGAWRHNEANNPTYGPDEHWWAQTSIAEDGKSWDVEFVIKKSTLVGGETQDMPMGFNVNINDDDDGGNRETQLNWDGDPHTESSYGELILLSAIPSDPNAVADRTVRFGLLDQSAGVRTEALDIRNAGATETLTISDPVITGPDADFFTFSDFPTSLAPGETASATITFDSGKVKGDYEATLSYKTNDPNPTEADLSAQLSAKVANLAGPIARYSLDDSDGTMFDISNFGRSGTYEGGATLGQDPLVPGGSSALFSGGGRGEVPGDVFDSFIRFSVSAWVNLNDLGDQQTIFAKGADGVVTFALLSSGGDLQWFSNGVPEFDTDGPVLTAGTTHHVVITWSTVQAAIYVDGVLVAEQVDPVSIEIVQENAFVVGSFFGGLNMNGRMDDVQFYNRAISPENVLQLFEAPGSELSNVEDLPVEFTQLWLLGDDQNGNQAEFSQEQGMNEAPGSATAQDDDYYFWGVYPDPIGAVTQNEPFTNYDRAHVPSDPFNRIHFNLDAESAAADTKLRLTFAMCCLGAGEGIEGEHDLVYRLNGKEFFSQDAVVDDLLVQEIVTAGDYDVVEGANTIEIERTGGSESSWIQYDYVRIEASAGAPVSPPTATGIVSQWRFENNLDDSGAASATADTLTATGDAAYAPGVVGQAVSITADGLQRLRAEDSDDLDLQADWTLEAFVWPDANNTGEWDRFWTKWGDGGEQWHTAFRSTGAVDVENGLDLFINGGDNIINSNTTAEVPLETWSHVAFVGDSVAGTITAWLNGVEVGSTAYQAVTPGDGAMNFGNFESPANGLQYSGLIDEAAIHNVAVSPDYLAGQAALIDSGGNGNGIPALVDLDASGLSAGAASAWTNTGSLGGEFQPFGDPMVEVVDGYRGVTLDGDGDYFEGPVSTPEIEGSSPRSIIAWIYNPELASEETVVSWGKRGGPNGTNMSFNHGWHNQFGAVGHWGGDGPDIGWHPTNNVNDDDPNNLGDAQAGTWTHISYTQTGAFTKVFTNGQLSNSEDAALDTFSGLGILVGAQREPDGETVTAGLKGSLSVGRVRIFDSALSDEDILADFVATAEDYGVTVGPGERLPGLMAVGIGEDGAFTATLPDGVTADLEYSTDLINWEVIASGVSGAVSETDADRQAAPIGFYRAKQ